MTISQWFAIGFVLTWPLVTYAAWFTLRLARDQMSGISVALAAVTTAAALVASFLGFASMLFLSGQADVVRILSPGILPAFFILELLTIIIPFYLRTRRE